eukprot:scaffold524401_cov22-Prasinocladus_malaysianus.AAC.2
MPAVNCKFLIYLVAILRISILEDGVNPLAFGISSTRTVVTSDYGPPATEHMRTDYGTVGNRREIYSYEYG